MILLEIVLFNLLSKGWMDKVKDLLWWLNFNCLYLIELFKIIKIIKKINGCGM